MRRAPPHDIIRERIRKILFLIRALDGLRAGFHSNLEKIKNVIEDLGLSNDRINWDAVINEAKEILRMPRKDPSFKYIEFVLRVAGSMSIISLIEIILSFILMLVGSSPSLYFSLVFSAFILINISYFLRAYASSKVRRIYSEMHDELEKRGETLRRAVDRLFLKLKSELKKVRRSPEEVRIKLRFCDYSNIEVLKSPSLLRKEYIITLKSR